MSLYGAGCPGCATLLRIPLQNDLEKTCVLCPKCSTQFFAIAPVAVTPSGLASFDLAKDQLPGFALDQYTTSLNSAPRLKNSSVKKPRKSWTGMAILATFVLCVAAGIVTILSRPGDGKLMPPNVGQTNRQPKLDTAALDLNKIRKPEVATSERSNSNQVIVPPIKPPDIPKLPPQLSHRGVPQEMGFVPPTFPGDRFNGGPGSGFPHGNPMIPSGNEPTSQFRSASMKDFEGPRGVRIFATNAEKVDVKSFLEHLQTDLNIRTFIWSSQGENLEIGLQYSGAISDIVNHIEWGEIVEADSEQRIIRMKAKMQ